jgi:hypothetical protein
VNTSISVDTLKIGTSVLCCKDLKLDADKLAVSFTGKVSIKTTVPVVFSGETFLNIKDSKISDKVEITGSGPVAIHESSIWGKVQIQGMPWIQHSKICGHALITGDCWISACRISGHTKIENSNIKNSVLKDTFWLLNSRDTDGRYFNQPLTIVHLERIPENRWALLSTLKTKNKVVVTGYNTHIDVNTSTTNYRIQHSDPDMDMLMVIIALRNGK